MGKAFVFGMVGLISIGLLLGFGFAIKLLVVTFLGKRKKESNEPQPLTHSSGCRCSLCAGPGAHGVHKHY